MISSLESESDQNRQWNLEGLKSESSLIRFWRPNHISLPVGNVVGTIQLIFTVL